MKCLHASEVEIAAAELVIKKPPPESGEQGDHVLREAERYPTDYRAQSAPAPIVNRQKLLTALPEPHK